jgi:phosphoribosyl-ATP pyrophosphohydrolase/phosphoribosyl-AMP cyclohydrolase
LQSDPPETAVNSSDIAFLSTLESVIRDRLDNPESGSYTASLAAGGVQRVAQKVGEEGVELALAAAVGDRDGVIEEAADLVYHLLVLLHAQGLDLGRVVACLQERHGARA